MSFADTFIIWLAINVACLAIAAVWSEAVLPGRVRAVDPWAASVIVPIICALGAGILLLGYMIWLTFLLWWDTILLKLIGWLIRKIPREPRSQIQRRLVLWATTRLSAHVNRWLKPGAGK